MNEKILDKIDELAGELRDKARGSDNSMVASAYYEVAIELYKICRKGHYEDFLKKSIDTRVLVPKELV